MRNSQIDLAWPRPELDLTDDWLADLYAMSDRRQQWLRVNFVSSVDGAATRDGLSGGLSSVADKRVFDMLRRLADVVLVGAGTVRAEGYGPMRVDLESSVWREAHGLAPQPVFAIVSGSLGLDPSSPIFTNAPVRPIVITTARAPQERLAELRRVADVIVAGDDQLDVGAAQLALTERGHTQTLCEGGPSLFGALLASDAVDELCLTISPSLEAGAAGRIAHGEIPGSLNLNLQHVLVSEQTLMLRYTRSN
jgi:riboflavin biosynthesis pyrimidine reductase